MFNITREKLEETEQTLEDTTNRLVDTKKTLVKTRVDRDEQKFLVSQHIKSEAKLHSQATQVEKAGSLAREQMLICLAVINFTSEQLTLMVYSHWLSLGPGQRMGPGPGRMGCMDLCRILSHCT